MKARKPLASLSLDLDNKWSYLKTHGDPGWESFPSYLDVVVPRILDLLVARGLKITFFVVGQDAALEKNRRALEAIAAAGHEVGNHSFRHEPWLHLYSEAQVEDELGRTEEAIQEVCGVRPVGFRGPGFSLSPMVLRALARRGYFYDASTFPTFLGPLARAYYFMKARKMSPEERSRRGLLFGSFREGFRPLRAYRWGAAEGGMVEIPVTTMPIFRLPIHFSYLLYLGTYSARLALAYFRTALGLCQVTGTPPSLLLHPLDFLGREEAPELAFFPAMNVPSRPKLDLLGKALDHLGASYRVVTMREHAAAVATSRPSPPKPDPLPGQPIRVARQPLEV